MSYHFSKTLAMPFHAAVEATIATLEKHGFGVLSDIDVQAALRKKLNVAFRPYRILGACNPTMAYRALEIEDKIGTMLPCNVIVQQHANGLTEVSAVDPVASMQAIDNPDLAHVAEEVRDMLQQVIAQLDEHAGEEGAALG
jgi:uncharacterized protein (DUF302 family)